MRHMIRVFGWLAMVVPVAANPQNSALTTRETEIRAVEAAAAAKAAPKVAADKMRPRVGGFWEPVSKADTLRTVDGKSPPLNAAGRRLQQQRMAAIRAGKSEDPMKVCLPPGTPRDMLSPGPFMIVQTPDKITMLHESRHLIRHVYLDGPLKLDDADPWWEGHFSGQWQEDALVIETGGFNGEQWLDSTGLPQSPDMKVMERFRLKDPDTLEDTITIEDSKFYSAPWTARLTFRRLSEAGRHLYQDECGETILEYPLKEYAPPR